MHAPQLMFQIITCIYIYIHQAYDIMYQYGIDRYVCIHILHIHCTENGNDRCSNPKALHQTNLLRLRYHTFCTLAGVDHLDAPPGLPSSADSLDVWPLLSGASLVSPRKETPLAIEGHPDPAPPPSNNDDNDDDNDNDNDKPLDLALVSRSVVNSHTRRNAIRR